MTTLTLVPKPYIPPQVYTIDVVSVARDAVVHSFKLAATTHKAAMIEAGKMLGIAEDNIDFVVRIRRTEEACVR